MIADPAMFPRFGSVIICIGVIFGVKARPQLLDAAQPVFEEEIQEIRNALDLYAMNVKLKRKCAFLCLKILQN